MEDIKNNGTENGKGTVESDRPDDNGAKNKGRRLVSLNEEEANLAVERFRKLLRFETVSATAAASGAYRRCADYLVELLEDVGCFTSVEILPESPPDCPVVVAEWSDPNTTDPDLPVLVLNSHYDVVPADASDWRDDMPPFEANIDESTGEIYGRGTQDMKSVCVQYIEAVRFLHHHEGFRPARTVVLTYVPDEEVGGAGMAAFLASEKFHTAWPGGIGLALDEGLATPTDTYSVFYGERLPWFVGVKARGRVGHGSRFVEDTAVEKLLELLRLATAFREGQRELLHSGVLGNGRKHTHGRNGFSPSTVSNCSHAVAVANRTRAALEKSSGEGVEPKIGDVTSLNITTLQAGVKVADTYAYNCVPPLAEASLDIRISPHVDPKDMKGMLDGWCRDCSSAEHSVTWNFVRGEGPGVMRHGITPLKSNAWYDLFRGAMDDMELSVQTEVFPAATDSRFLRAMGIRALGFSPMRRSPILLHEHNERLERGVFLEGISVYVGLLRVLAGQGRMEADNAGPTVDQRAAEAIVANKRPRTEANSH